MQDSAEPPLGRSGERPPARRKRVYIRTFGCQMNVYDSERMTEALGAGGYDSVERPEDADLVLVNTCHIREKAAEKVYSDLGRLAAIKRKRARRGAETLIAVAGCVAQAEGGEIARRAPVVDLVVGPQSYHRLPDLVARAGRGAGVVIDTELPEEDKFACLPARATGRGPSAFLTVQEGCDKFCTFCVVPYTRGSEVSRPVEQLLAEARHLVAGGVRELTLLGQNVNAYHGRGPDGGAWPLADLIVALCGIERLERLRYTTSHPRDMTDDLIAAHASNPKLMPYLHLPFQAGSDRILAAMNRRHTAADYVALVERIRRARPDIALSTDIIVGFPGETEAEFTATLQLAERIGFAQAYMFKYSPRPGTPAASLGSQVPESEKADRLGRLQALLERQQRAFGAAMVGRVLPVLFEKEGRKPGQLVGRSPYLQAVHAEAKADLMGRIAPVEIVEARPNSLKGVIRGA